ncbi:MAG: glycosyltransferase family 4 protein [Acutalibacteraceae bacterium]|nr:glycosyltransferase family 4 protein [Acutalibacteraceae bacterium]
MMNMKILIISQHFFPDSFRINEIATELKKRGNEVTVITSLPDYSTGKVPKDCRGIKNRKIVYNGVSVIRTFSFSRRRGVLFRTLNYVSFCLSSTLKALFLKEKFDLVLSYQTSPVLMANAARTVANKQKIPFVIYCLDVWPESLKAWGVMENNPLFKFMHYYSKKMYNRADVLAVSSKPFISYMETVNGVKSSNILYIPQHSEDMNLPIKKEIGSPVRFAFGGNIGSVQNVDCIVRAVAEIKNQKDFAVEIYGDGSELENVKKLALDLGVLDKIIFFGRVDRDSLWERYKNADAFLLTLKSEGVIGLTAPAKLQEYMSGNRPIIASIGGAAEEIIKSSNCGICVPADDYVALSGAMNDFILNKTSYNELAQNGRKYFEENFTLDVFMDSLEKAFKKAKG